MEFSDWITNKYIEWRGNRVGQSSSISEFAKLFGASQSLMSQWMMKNGKIPRQKKYINALFTQYGNEVYEILGYEHAESSLPEYPLLVTIFKETLNTLKDRKIKRGSEEELDVLKEIAAKYNVTIIERNKKAPL